MVVSMQISILHPTYSIFALPFSGYVLGAELSALWTDGWSKS